MQKTTYQVPEIRNDRDVIIQSGAYGKNTAFCNTQNNGILDYINNNLEALHDDVVLVSNGTIPKFSSLRDFGITGNTTINALANVINNLTFSFETYLSQGTLLNGVTDLPIGYCMIHIAYWRGNRIVIELLGADRCYRFVGNMDGLRNLQPSNFRRYDGVAI